MTRAELGQLGTKCHQLAVKRLLPPLCEDGESMLNLLLEQQTFITCFTHQSA